MSRRNRETRAKLRRYSPAHLARLALSDAAVGLADEAMRLAATGSQPEDWSLSRYSVEDHLGSSPRRLEEAAERLVVLSVFYMRTQGASWEDVGNYFGVSKQTAHERFESVVARLEQSLFTPYGIDDPDDPPFGYLPEGAFPVPDPEETGARLDSLVAAWRAAVGDDRHDDDPTYTAHPVTAGLPERFPLETMRRALWREETWAEDNRVAGSDPEFMADLLETKAEVFDGLAAEARRDNMRLKSVRMLANSSAEIADGARSRAAALRAAHAAGDVETREPDYLDAALARMNAAVDEAQQATIRVVARVEEETGRPLDLD